VSWNTVAGNNPTARTTSPAEGFRPPLFDFSASRSGHYAYYGRAKSIGRKSGSSLLKDKGDISCTGPTNRGTDATAEYVWILIGGSIVHVSVKMQECIQECKIGSQVCLVNVTHCLEKGGRHAEPQHIRLLLDCAEICQTSANFMIRGSELHARTCGVCTEVCEACARSCESFKDDAEMQRCAEACRRCAQSCREMAAMAA